MSKENMNLGDFIIQGNKNRSEQSIFDSHAHYDHPLFNGDGPELVKRMHDIGALEHLVIPAITYESNHSARELFKEETFPYVSFAAGIHPKVASNMNPRDVDWDEIDRILLSDRTVAVKTGLDFSNTAISKAQIKNQIVICDRFMGLAEAHDLPLVFHLRDSLEWFLKAMNFRVLPTEAEVHCYMGDSVQAQRLMDVGVNYFGIGGAVTRDGFEDLRESVKSIPLSSILLETDAPFQKPKDFQGRVNDSSSLLQVAREIGRIKGISEEEVIRATYQNAKSFFKINE